MPYKTILLSLLVFLSVTVKGQNLDTVYFDIDWQKIEDGDYRFYRIASPEDTLIKILDYYKNGSLQWKGRIKKDFTLINKGTFEGEERGKCEFYFKSGTVEIMEVYQPLKNLTDIVEFYKEPITDSSSLTNLHFTVYFFKNSKVRSFGFEDLQQNRYQTWFFYSRNGRLTSKEEYGDDPNSFLNVLYNQQGNVIVSCEYKNGKRDGAYKYYWSSGLFFQTGKYEGGKKVGRWITYDTDGHPQKFKYYEKGKRVK